MRRSRTLAACAAAVLLQWLTQASAATDERPIRIRLGLSTAYYELPDGSIGQVPGPYVDIDGQPWVASLRRRAFLQSQVVEKAAGSRAAAGHATRREVPVNNPLGDILGTGNTQTDPSAVVSGDTIVCGFTDSAGGFDDSHSTSGYAYSLDAGVTWLDGGTLPLAGAGPSEMLLGKPILLTDGVGRWYAVSPYDIGNGMLGRGSGDYGLSVSAGRFAGSVLQWGPPLLVAGGDSPGAALDFHHAVLDPKRDRLYITYTDVTPPVQWGQIEVVTLGNHATQVLHSLILQPEIPGYNNGGSRLALGASGEVFCAWQAGVLSGFGQGPALQRITRSLDSGATFEPSVVAATVIESWFTNPPGSTREDFHPEFPAIAVDTLPGQNQGRVHLAWHDGVEMNFSFPATGLQETTLYNNTPASAQVLPAIQHLFVDGSLLGSDPVDYYRFSGTAGQHFRSVVEVQTGLLWPRLVMWCTTSSGTDPDTLLAASSIGVGGPALALFTLPYTGTYTLAIQRVALYGNYRAWFRRTNATFPSVATDFRDVVVVSSPDGINNWSSKVRVNDDVTLGGQAWPEILLDRIGLHLFWFDWRADRRCHSLSDAYVATSLDAGTTFQGNVRLSSQSSWWQVPADGFPNFGDWIRPAAGNGRLVLPWTDSREGDPDIRATVLSTQFVLEAPDSLQANEGQPLALALVVENGAVAGDTIDVEIGASCGGALPAETLTAETLLSFERRTLFYSPVVHNDIHDAAPCTIQLQAQSRRTGRSQSASVVVVNDGPVAIAIRDFRSHFDGRGVLLEWSAARHHQFRLARARNAGGPFEALLEPASTDGDGAFRAYDPRVEPGSTWFYRLWNADAHGAWRAAATYEVSAATPQRIHFAGARPNPFNPQTQLRFELPRAAAVHLDVFDVHGRRVARLLHAARRDVGAHAVVWDGRDAHGRVLASGVYLAELRVDGQRYTSRLVLLR